MKFSKFGLIFLGVWAILYFSTINCAGTGACLPWIASLNYYLGFPGLSVALFLAVFASILFAAKFNANPHLISETLILSTGVVFNMLLVYCVGCFVEIIAKRKKGNI